MATGWYNRGMAHIHAAGIGIRRDPGMRKGCDRMKKLAALFLVGSYLFLNSHCAVQAFMLGDGHCSNPAPAAVEKKSCHSAPAPAKAEKQAPDACGSILVCCEGLDVLPASHIIPGDLELAVVSHLPAESGRFADFAETVRAFGNHGPPRLAASGFPSALGSRAPPQSIHA